MTHPNHSQNPRMKIALMFALLAGVITPHIVWGQAAAGSISGTVTNADKKQVPGH